MTPVGLTNTENSPRFLCPEDPISRKNIAQLLEELLRVWTFEFDLDYQVWSRDNVEICAATTSVNATFEIANIDPNKLDATILEATKSTWGVWNPRILDNCFQILRFH
jgi:hypothetical protein